MTKIIRTFMCNRQTEMVTYTLLPQKNLQNDVSLASSQTVDHGPSCV